MVDSYLRFVVLKNDEGSNVEQGLFAAMGELESNLKLYPYEEDLQSKIYLWFKKNLPVPNVLTGKNNKKQVRAISWFKPTADVHFEKMRDYGEILEAQGLLVKQIITKSRVKYYMRTNFKLQQFPSRILFEKYR